MERDIKEIIGVLMRVIDGGEISLAELAELEFEAEDELLATLNETYIRLLEFAHDYDRRSQDRKYDSAMRLQLQECLDTIVRLCDHTPRGVTGPGRGEGAWRVS